MQIYVAHIETRRTRLVRFAAKSAATAERSANVLLRPGDKLVSVDPLGLKDPVSARSAIDHLLDRDYLPIDGQMHTVGEWLRLALTAPEDFNPRLALAGLRISEGSIVIASPVSIPVLSDWFADTPWAGQALLQTLDALPGASRSNFTFAGRRARALLLPAAVVLEGDA